MERTAPCLPLDNRLRIETPEGIDLWLRPAGVIPRALAFGIDLLIRGALILTLIMLLAPLRQLGEGLLLILLFLLNWWYMVLFEVLNQGRSPGKKLLKLRVVQEDGTPIGWANSLLRNLLRFSEPALLGRVDTVRPHGRVPHLVTGLQDLFRFHHGRDVGVVD